MQRSPQASTSGTQNFVSPQQFRGFPKAGPRKSVGRRRKGKIIIATDIPEIDEIANIEKPRESEKKEENILKNNFTN